MYVKRNNVRVRATVVAVEKQYVLHILSVSIASVTQHAMCRRHIVICGLSSSTILFHISP